MIAFDDRPCFGEVERSIMHILDVTTALSGTLYIKSVGLLTVRHPYRLFRIRDQRSCLLARLWPEEPARRVEVNGL